MEFWSSFVLFTLLYATMQPKKTAISDKYYCNEIKRIYGLSNKLKCGDRSNYETLRLRRSILQFFRTRNDGFASYEMRKKSIKGLEVIKWRHLLFGKIVSHQKGMRYSQL